MERFENVLAIIPARGGSKRLPGKNIKMLAGKPLIAHSIEFAKNSKYINKVVLSTDDTEIANVGKEYGADVIMRPAELAADTAKTAPVLVHAVDELEKQGYKPDVIILLQATCPVREDNLTEKLMDILYENPQYDSIFTGFRKSYTMATWVKNHNNISHALYDYHLRPRWQEVEVNDYLIGEDGKFYAIKYDTFRKVKDFIGENPYIYEVERTIDIDTKEDFEIAEKLIQK